MLLSITHNAHTVDAESKVYNSTTNEPKITLACDVTPPENFVFDWNVLWFNSKGEELADQKAAAGGYIRINDSALTIYNPSMSFAIA